MRKNSRKGFTIVELVIVIAVIAILAAVLIPTFSGIIDKANTSADIQLIREANMLIHAEMIDLDKNLTEAEAEKVLADNGIDISKVTNTDNEFYYISEKSCYVIWNIDDSKITYPEDVAASLKNWTPNGSVARIESTYYNTLNDAVDGANVGDTIIVLKDIETSEQVFINKDIIVDLGGHSYIMENFKYQDSDTYPGGIVIGKNVRVQNGTFKNGTIKLIGNARKDGYAFYVENCQKFTVVGITLDLTEAGDMRGGFGISNVPTVIVEDCTFEGVTKQGNKKCAIYLDNWVGGSFEEGKYLNLIVKGNSTIKGEIKVNCNSTSYVKTVLENSVDCNSTLVAFTGCLPKGWKIKTPNGEKLDGMESFSDKDAEGYFTYTKP